MFGTWGGLASGGAPFARGRIGHTAARGLVDGTELAAFVTLPGPLRRDALVAANAGKSTTNVDDALLETVRVAVPF
jgi:hypothetical protein